MYSTKTLLKAATFALLAATGIGAASAQPYDSRYDTRWDRRDYDWRSHDRMVDRFAPRAGDWRIAQTLRLHGLRMAGEPMTFRGRITVRAHDRFGRLVIVHLDRRGDLIRINRL
jgi:hypothetical protein